MTSVFKEFSKNKDLECIALNLGGKPLYQLRAKNDFKFAYTDWHGKSFTIKITKGTLGCTFENIDCFTDMTTGWINNEVILQGNCKMQEFVYINGIFPYHATLSDVNIYDSVLMLHEATISKTRFENANLYFKGYIHNCKLQNANIINKHKDNSIYTADLINVELYDSTIELTDNLYLNTFVEMEDAYINSSYHWVSMNIGNYHIHSYNNIYEDIPPIYVKHLDTSNMEISEEAESLTFNYNTLAIDNIHALKMLTDPNFIGFVRTNPVDRIPMAEEELYDWNLVKRMVIEIYKKWKIKR